MLHVVTFSTIDSCLVINDGGNLNFCLYSAENSLLSLGGHVHLSE